MSEHIGAGLDRARRLFADREAAVDDVVRWSYGELERHVAGFDGALDALGLAAGEVVAVLMLNSAAHLVCWLAIPRSGRVLNDLNVRLAPAELEFILEDSGARVLIVDDAFLELGRALVGATPRVEHLVYAGAPPTPGGCLAFGELCDAIPRPLGRVDPEAVAGIFYTGGTTGLPKGAMLTHRNLVANAKHILITWGYAGEDRYLHAAPMFHLADGSGTYALTMVGGCHVTIPAFDPELWLRTVTAERITHAVLVPTMVNIIVNHPTLADHDLSSLRSINYGGSPMPEAVIKQTLAVIGCDLRQGYGMTEAAPLVSSLSPEDHRRGAAGEQPFAARLRSAGVPAVGVEAEVRRSDGSPCDVGETGEIWVRGPNVMKGYWNRPEETAAALDQDGWYHTGDAAYADADGYLYVVDRVKDMIITGGENVYSVEVENALHQHTAVLEAAVFGIPDERWGERVHAVVVLQPHATTTENELLAFCRELIAGYKLPRSIELRSEPLPKSGAGKVLKRELRERHWEPHQRKVN